MSPLHRSIPAALMLVGFPVIGAAAESGLPTATAAHRYAAGPFSAPEYGALNVSPNGQWAVFTRHTPQPCRLFTSNRDPKTGQWSEPEPAPFSSAESDDGDPFITADGASVFFWSCRGGKIPGVRTSEIYMVRRSPQGWGDPVALGPEINVPGTNAGFPSVANDGTLYFFARPTQGGGEPDLYCARRVGRGSYAAVENLGPAVNSTSADLDGLIAPDGSFLIFCSNRPGGFGGFDVYVSERRDGQWSPARNAGAAINSAGDEFCPALSSDGQRFYFSRSNPRDSQTVAGTYEVEADVLGLSSQRSPRPVASSFSPQAAHALGFGPGGALSVGRERKIWQLAADGTAKQIAELPAIDADRPRVWSLAWHAGQLYGAAHDRIIRVAADGAVTNVVEEKFPGPCGVTDLVFDERGEAYVVYANVVARYDAAWRRTVVLDGGQTTPKLRWVTSLCVDREGRFWLSDVAGKRVVMATLNAARSLEIQRVVDLPDFPEYLAVSRSGAVYVGFPDGNALARLDQTGAPVLWRLAEKLQGPVGMAFGGEGFDPDALYIAGSNGVTVVTGLR